MAAALAAARRTGLPADDAAVLAEGTNLVVHLRPAPVVARVTRIAHLIRPVQELRAAVTLAGAIQGAVTLVPDTLAVEDKGFRPLYDLAALNLPASQTVIAFQRSFVASKRDVAQRLVDSVVTAIGMVEQVWVMVVAMVIAMLVMLWFAPRATVSVLG